MNYRLIAKQVFLAGVNRVIPEQLITKLMTLKNEKLLVGNLCFLLKEINKIYVIGAGKAGALMAAEVEKILGDRVIEGHIVVKYDYSCRLKYIRVTEAGHPVPDSNGFEATRAILNIAAKAGSNDLVICLLSGGGSSLLADFPEGSSPEEMILVNNLLINSGASINEINTVRKHLSLVKGGQLAKAVYPATLLSLVLSDVIGDPLNVIASGPTTPDPTTFSQALCILDKYKLLQSVPEGILKYLHEGDTEIRSETPKPGDPVFEKTFNLLIGTNRLALEACKMKAKELKLNSFIIDDKVQGDVATIAEFVIETSLKYKNDKNVQKPVCLLFGGEPTIKMTGKGLGGRNQHLALLCGIRLQNHPGITVLSAGTDGTDGPTDAAGAVVDSETVYNAIVKKVDPEKYLKEFDSYIFFKKAGGHIITGPTRTNVMDIIISIVE
jgi:hydroxypyruvate reductase/glycerate 2-kinase